MNTNQRLIKSSILTYLSSQDFNPLQIRIVEEKVDQLAAEGEVKVSDNTVAILSQIIDHVSDRVQQIREKYNGQDTWEADYLNNAISALSDAKSSIVMAQSHQS